MIVTSSIGMAHHARLYARTYGFDYVPVGRAREFKDIYQFGVYEYEDYENIRNRAEGKVVVHWCGSDVFSFARRVRLKKFVVEFNPNITHIAQSVRQASILRGLGLNVKVHARFNDDRDKYQVSQLPIRFTPLVLYDTSRADQFCLNEIMSVIQCSTFDFVLLSKEKYEERENIKWITPIDLLERPEEYRNLLKSCSCLIRFDKQGTEGFSQMVMQMFLLGRRVISNTVQPFVTITQTDPEALTRSLYQLSLLTVPAIDAAAYYREMSLFDLREYA